MVLDFWVPHSKSHCQPTPLHARSVNLKGPVIRRQISNTYNIIILVSPMRIRAAKYRAVYISEYTPLKC